MATTNPAPQAESSAWSGTAIVAVIATAVALAHLLTNGRYGFHRDELQTLSDALHLDWGFVAYPPFTPFVERISMAMFGTSLVGLRLFSVIASAAAVVLTGRMAAEAGGGRWAQATAALAVALSPLPLFEGTEFQYTTFDYLWWVLIAWLVMKLLNSANPRWLVPIGAAIGIGLQTKYTMAFYVAGIIAGMVLTPARRYFLSRWFWAGAALAGIIFLPNLIWQFRHGFISLHFLQSIHARDVGEGRAQHFWSYQLLVNISRVAAPLALIGLAVSMAQRRYRMLACMYLVPLLVMAIAKGRFYYVGAAYPMLIALGAAAAERGLSLLPRMWRWCVEGGYLAGLIAWGVLTSTVVLPLAAAGPLRVRALANNGDLREEIGWDDLVRAVAGVRDSLPPEQQRSLGVLVGNYGEEGAIEVMGRAYGLPTPISTTNSAWLRGYPLSPPQTLIVVGHSRRWLEKNFTACRVAGHNGNSLGVHNEEADDHPDIFVCGPPLLPWPEFWAQNLSYG
ncbi:MAG: glycosyltransferase family 39 protein [Acidobacteria bacterium]|nr:glycosyltransferase family 39 protein [Acidobacteriota bacterium]